MGDTSAASETRQEPPRYPQQHQTLPSINSLTNGLPPSSRGFSPEQQSATDSTRDSGIWPGSSKHNSANSNLQLRTLLNPDDSPPRNSVPNTPLSANYIRNSAHSGSSALPAINQGFPDLPGNRDSQASFDSRRSSVDSRMQHQMGGLYLNRDRDPTSPYESANTSQVSLAASLRLPNGRGPMSPLSGRTGVRSHAPPRVAPPIMPVGRSSGQPDPLAAKPTAGFAWAFPDSVIPEERRGSDSGDSSVEHNVSRTNSFAASSIRSSIFSNDSQLPIGQRRFDDEQQTTHHHSMKHRSISNLQSDHLAAQAAGNYSRTPELRVSHKLAERKRRSEMKDLFEELNKSVPQSTGAKASKWEILTKAIDYIHGVQSQEQRMNSDMTRLHREADYSREVQKENEMLRTEIQVMHQHLRRLDPNAPHVYGQLTSQLSQSQPQPPAQPQPQTNGSSGLALPPLNPPSSSGRHDAPTSQYTQPGAMQGVEYGYGQR